MASTTDAFLVVAVALVVIWGSRMLFKRRKLNLPPGPRALPIIGCLHLLGKQPCKNFAELARKYGPMMSVPLGQRYCVVATSPDAAREFLRLQDANFSSRPTLRAAEVIFPNDVVFHDHTPVSRHIRKILESEFMSVKRLEAYKHIRSEEMVYMLSSIAKEAGRPVQVVTHINIKSYNIISRMVLNKRFLGGPKEDQQFRGVSEVQEFIDIVKCMAACLATTHLHDIFSFLPRWFDPQGLDKRYRHLRARMEVFFRSMIEQHKEERWKNPVSKEQRSLLSVLLEQLQYPELGVTEEHVLGTSWDAFAAGTESATSTSEWTMAEILRNPTSMKKAREELDRVVGLHRVVQESDIPQLKYIQALVKESFRLHPSIPLLIPHQSISATKAFGYDIPARTQLFVNVWGIGRDPTIWERPLDFVAERFLDGAAHATTDVQGQHFELIPFEAGRRQCSGMVLGLLMVHLQVANLLHAFDWSLPDGLKPDQLDMSDGFGLAPRMKNSLIAVPKPRLAPHLYQY